MSKFLKIINKYSHLLEANPNDPATLGAEEDINAPGEGDPSTSTNPVTTSDPTQVSAQTQGDGTGMATSEQQSDTVESAITPDPNQIRDVLQILATTLKDNPVYKNAYDAVSKISENTPPEELPKALADFLDKYKGEGASVPSSSSNE